MSISPSLENKSTISPTLEDKTGKTLTWNDMTMTWDEETAPWDSPKIVGTKETKNSVTGTFEPKL